MLLYIKVFPKIFAEIATTVLLAVYINTVYLNKPMRP